MITPLIKLDSREQWRPCAVEAVLEAGAQINGYPVDLENLPAAGGKIDFPKDMRQPDTPVVGYHRAANGGRLCWHQFWLFYLYNPKAYMGIGAHEGDWEMVQIGCSDVEGDWPILMTFSQHGGGAKREFWSVELEAGQPVVYVARDSHANYPTPTRDVTDQADGGGEPLQIAWHDFGSWTDWPGTWGNSDNSPGPLATRRAWTAPHAYHSQARG